MAQDPRSNAMELYHLRTFVKVADTGNLTRASALLHISQPAISAQIKALEEELEVQLFSRSARGMDLTSAGEQLYAEAEATLAAAERVRQRAQSLRHEIVGSIRLGIHTDPQFLQLGTLFDGMREQHPQVQMHIRQSSTVSIFGELRTGEADAGFMYGQCRAADMHWTPLLTVPMGLCLPQQNADLRDAPIQALCELPWVYTTPECPFAVLSEALYEQAGSRPQSIAWVDNEETVRSLAGSGAGVAMMRLDDAQAFEAAGRGVAWRGHTGALAMGLVRLAKRAQEPALVALDKHVRALFAVEDAALSESG